MNYHAINVGGFVLSATADNTCWFSSGSRMVSIHCELFSRNSYIYPFRYLNGWIGAIHRTPKGVCFLAHFG
ncbi:MAG: hypothetical protein R6U96_02160 [Promethearchaeia archaeon]